MGLRTWLQRFDKERVGFWCALVGWLAVFVTLRALSLDADPPRELPNDGSSQELWAEGAAKAQEARNWALFGKWQANPADNYQFWRPQAPVWVYSLAGFLKLFGVSTLAHRAHSIVVAALGFGLLMVYARPHLSRVAWGFLGLLLAGNFYYVLYTRAGLIEPMVNLFSMALVFCCYQSLSRPLWLLPATWTLLCAVFSKMSGLYLLPLFAVCAAVSFARHRALGWRFWLIPGLHAALLMLLVVLYMAGPTYQQRVVWVIAHMAYNKDGQTEVDFGRISLLDVPARLVDWRRWKVHFFSLFPVSATLSLVSLGHTLYIYFRERRLDWHALNLLWFLAAFAPMQLTSNTYVRFYLVLFMPLALLGASGLDLLLGWLRSRPLLRGGLAAGVTATFLVVHGSHYQSWWEGRTYSVRDTNREVLKLVGKHDAVFVGMWAPWLMFDTPYQFYTVRSYFNTNKEALGQLGVTHLLLRPRDASGAHVREHYPRQFKKKRLLERFRVRQNTITLYELRKPLRVRAKAR